MNALHIFLGMVGPWQWIIIGLAILLLFGGKKLPELMKGLGGGIKEFKKATKEEDEEDKKIDEKKELMFISHKKSLQFLQAFFVEN